MSTSSRSCQVFAKRFPFNVFCSVRKKWYPQTAMFSIGIMVVIKLITETPIFFVPWGLSHVALHYRITRNDLTTDKYRILWCAGNIKLLIISKISHEENFFTWSSFIVCIECIESDSFLNALYISRVNSVQFHQILSIAKRITRVYLHKTFRYDLRIETATLNYL